jgi:hypothetical protein
MLHPKGCIRLRRKKPKDFVGYEYPIYVKAKAPLHDIYGSQGTIIAPILGHLVIDYRSPDSWGETDYVRAGFSEYVLSTDFHIRGPADLRIFEIASFDSPVAEIKLELGIDDQLKAGPASRPAHQKLALVLGIEPERFDRVDAAWSATGVDGTDPEDNDEFMDKLDEILDQQDIEENADDPWGPSFIDSDATETIVITEGDYSVADTISTVTEVEVDPVQDQPLKADLLPTPPPERNKFPKGNLPIQDELEGQGTPIEVPVVARKPVPPDVLLAAMRKSLSSNGRGERSEVEPPDIRHGPKPGVTRPRPRHPPETLRRFSHLENPGGTKDRVRNPSKPERRKSFEKAAARLAAIPRTVSGDEGDWDYQTLKPELEPGYIRGG